MCSWLKYKIEASVYHFMHLPINTNQEPVTVYKLASYKVLTTLQHSRLSTSDGSWEHTFFFLSFTLFEILFMCGFMKPLAYLTVPKVSCGLETTGVVQVHSREEHNLNLGF